MKIFRKGWGTLWLALGLALLTGIAVLVRPPLSIPPNFESYDALGWNLARGAGFTFNEEGIESPYFFRTPGYPLFLAAVYSLFGHTLRAVFVFQIGFHLLTVILVYALTRRCFDKRVTAAASILTAVFPLTTMYIPTVLPETLSTFLTVLILWLFIRTLDGKNPWLALLTGGVIAYAALVRPVFGLFSLFLFAGAWWAKEGGRNLFSTFVILHLGFVLVWMPWVVRNYRLSGAFIPLSTEAQYQWWIGTLSVDEFVSRHWKNPNYYFQNLILINRLPYLHDASERPVPIQLIARGVEQLDPVRLHYRTDRLDPFVTKAMTPIGADRRQAEIPPQPPGTRVTYFLSFQNPFRRGERVRYPNRSDMRYFYVTSPDLLRKIEEPDLLEIHDLAAVGRVLLQRNREVLKTGVRLKLNESRPSILSSMDFLIRQFSQSPVLTLKGVEALDPNTLRLFLSNGADFLLPLQKNPGTLRRLVQSGGIDSPRHFVATVSRTSTAMGGANWQIVQWCGFDFRTFKALRDSDPCLKWIGPPTIDQDSRRNRAYLDLAWINLKRDFWKILRASAFRIPRLWVVVGTTSDKQAYQVGGGSILYPLLTLGTLVILALGIFGFVISRKRWRDHLFLTTPIIYLSLVHAPFHAEARYSVPGRPFFLIYSAVALIFLYTKIQDRFRQKRRPAGSPPESPASP